MLAALAGRLPVVTANKSLLAAHGDELFDAAAAAGVPLLYEASVLAGVPFLGTFARRALARDVTGLRGVVNGTVNYIVSRMAADRLRFDEALARAQHAGYAEPDPAKDVDGEDAVEKLCVLLRHFGGLRVQPGQLERNGVRDVWVPDLEAAAGFGGTIRPVIAADWEDARVVAYAGLACIDGNNALARVDGVSNAVAPRTRWAGELFFSGPGAGPTPTAATVLDVSSKRRIRRHGTCLWSRARLRDAWVRRPAGSCGSSPARRPATLTRCTFCHPSASASVAFLPPTRAPATVVNGSSPRRAAALTSSPRWILLAIRAQCVTWAIRALE